MLHYQNDLKIWPEFIEICERRNLLAHTDGIVSTRYLAVCREHNVDLKDIEVGRRLSINTKYYERAVSVIFELGIKLTQVVWRKLAPSEIGVAADELNELAYRLIVKRKYIEAITFLRFGLVEMKKHGEEATRKRMVVNLANAEKLGGNKEEAEKVLSSEDWSAAADNFTICAAAIRDDVQTVVHLMKAVVSAGHLSASDFQAWPVFEKVRSEPAFIEAFEREFGEKIVADLETPRKLDAEAEEENQAVSQTARSRGLGHRPAAAEGYQNPQVEVAFIVDRVPRGLRVSTFSGPDVPRTKGEASAG